MDTSPHTAPPHVSQFPSDQAAQELLKRLNLENASQEVKDKLLAQIADLLDQEILYQVMSRLTDEDMQALEAYLQPDDSGETQSLKPEAYEFIASRIPHLDVLIRDALVKVYDDIVTTKHLLDA